MVHRVHIVLPPIPAAGMAIARQITTVRVTATSDFPEPTAQIAAIVILGIQRAHIATQPRIVAERESVYQTTAHANVISVMLVQLVGIVVTITMDIRRVHIARLNLLATGTAIARQMTTDLVTAMLASLVGTVRRVPTIISDTQRVHTVILPQIAVATAHVYRTTDHAGATQDTLAPNAVIVATIISATPHAIIVHPKRPAAGMASVTHTTMVRANATLDSLEKIVHFAVIITMGTPLVHIAIPPQIAAEMVSVCRTMGRAVAIRGILVLTAGFVVTVTTVHRAHIARAYQIAVVMASARHTTTARAIARSTIPARIVPAVRKIISYILRAHIALGL